MAKTLLEFENETINTYDVKQISRDMKWDYKDCKQKFRLVINRDYVDSSLIVPIYEFMYETEILRDEKYELLKIQLDGLDYFEFVEG